MTLKILLCKKITGLNQTAFWFRGGGGTSQEVFPQTTMVIQRLVPRFLVHNKLNCDSAVYVNAWKLLIWFEFCQFMVVLIYSPLYSFCWREFQLCTREVAALCMCAVILSADCLSCICFAFLFLLWLYIVLSVFRQCCWASLQNAGSLDKLAILGLLNIA